VTEADVVYRRSQQARPVWPEGEVDAAHPRCAEMAEAMREGYVTFKDLLGQGFKPDEITEFFAQAGNVARDRIVRQVAPRCDMIADVIDKAKMAMPNRPPLPRGITETQAVLTAWNGYCQARVALTFDPWSSQRERCLRLLRAYLDRSELFAQMKDEIVNAVADSFPPVMQ
jgi:hypothetical protein